MAKEKPAVKTLRVPRDMAPLITAEAERQGIPENQWMLAVLAAAVGYKRPKK
jgi:hypothetical protein